MLRDRTSDLREGPPSGEYNPVIGKGVRWLDYENAAEAEDPNPKPSSASEADPESAPHAATVPSLSIPSATAPPETGSVATSGYERVASADGSEPERLASAGWAGPEPIVSAERARSERVSPAAWARSKGAHGAGGDWFELPGRPPPLARSRPYGRVGGLARPDPEIERDMARALEPGTRFPDPRGSWIHLINGEGPAGDPFRASNSADCALATLSTWHGEPVVAAPRHPEYDRGGRPLMTGESGATARIEQWVGQRFSCVGQGRHTYPLIAERLTTAGHGAAAVLIVRWPGGGSHAWNAVNSGGEVLWIDAQRGHLSVEPPYEAVTGVFAVILDRRGGPR